MVTGDRFDKRFDIEKAAKDVYYLGNRLLALTQFMLNGVKMRDPLTGLRVVRWEILSVWKPKSKSFDIEAELDYYVERAGYGIKEIAIQYRRRLGEKKLKVRHGFTIFKRIVMDGIWGNY